MTLPSTPRPLNLIGFCGNVQRPSKTRALVETVLARVAARHAGAAVDVQVFDLVDAMPDLGQTVGFGPLSDRLGGLIDRIADADALVVGSPVYKGSYTGLFKHFFDLIDPSRLVGLPVVLTATGGGDRHALVIEHQLRPLFGFFSAHTIATSIYASERDFVDGRPRSDALDVRIDAAVGDLAIWLSHADQHRLAATA